MFPKTSGAASSRTRPVPSSSFASGDVAHADKRARPAAAVGGAAAAPHAAPAAPASRGGFSFGFAPDPSAAAAAEPVAAPALLPTPAIAAPVPSFAKYAVALRGWSAMGGLSLRTGDVVAVDWDQSTGFDLFVTVMAHVEGEGWRETAASGFVPPAVLRLVNPDSDVTTTHSHQPAATKPVGAAASAPVATAARAQANATAAAAIAAVPATADGDGLVLEYDSVFDAVERLTQHAHHVATPLDVDSSLASFVWPLTVGEFMSRVYSRKCLVVHSTGARLARLRGDFHGFDVAEMVNAASRLVVWMRALKTGAMQYLDAGPDVALNAYASGHTLYFNPETSTQDRYVRSLSRDLGIDFGTDKEGGGGDVEVFAVTTRHSTPWHFDAQDNFSVQLAGTKRWTVATSGQTNPLTNLHPRSTNRASVMSDFKVHCDANGRADGIPGADCDSEHRPVAALDAAPQESFIVRPGSVFYHPAGIWHKVDALDDEGSLSINISLDSLRWLDVIMARLAQRMHRVPRWRGRVLVPPQLGRGAAGNAQGAAMRLDFVRGTIRGMLDELKTVVGGLNAEDFAPPALLLDNRIGGGADGEDDDGEGGGGEKRKAATVAAATAAGVDSDAFPLHDADAIVALTALLNPVSRTATAGATEAVGASVSAGDVVLRRNPLVTVIPAEPPVATLQQLQQPTNAGGVLSHRGWEAHSGFGMQQGFQSQYCAQFYTARDSTPWVVQGKLRAADVHATVVAWARRNDSPVNAAGTVTLESVQKAAVAWVKEQTSSGDNVDVSAVEHAVLETVSMLVHVGALVVVPKA